MMKKRFLAGVFSLCILTGCSENIKQSALDVLPEPSEAAITTATETVKEQKSEQPACTVPPQGLTISIEDELEVYEKLMVKDVISEPQIQLRNGSEIIDTSKTGEGEVNVSYIYNDKLYSHSVKYTVSDTTPPVVLNSGGGTALIGSDFDLNDYVGFVDNYDPTPELTYSGYVDTSTYGEYPITATAVDSSGNETTWELSITVADEEPSYEDDNERLPFERFITDYADDNVSFGIDVSRWQGDIDFEAVKNAGCSFVIMRIGTYYDEYTLDECFLYNFEAAKKAGLKVGVYIYTTANTKDEITDNAHWITEQLDGEKLDFPVVFDWEEFSNFQQYDMSINDLNEYFEIFADELEKDGYSAMLYSSKNFLNNFWYEHSEYPVWLAHYTDQTNYTGEYAMWQMSCFGNIDGIEGDVDFNILYNDKMKIN